MDFIPGATKSIRLYKGVFVYSNGLLHEVNPKQRNNSVLELDMLQELCEDIGIPENIKSERSSKVCGQKASYLKLAKDKRTNLIYAKIELSNEIYNVDISIIDLNKRWHHKMVSNNFHRRVWDFGLIILQIPSR